MNDPLESRLAELRAEYLRRANAGEPLDRDNFKREHIEFEQELTEFFDALDLTAEFSPESPHDAGPIQFGAVGRVCDPLASTDAFGETKNETTLHRAVTDLSGEVLGNYELIEPIGRGGMGVVYKARQVRLDRLVAVKLILAGRLASAEDVQRFNREARAAGRLKHPHIVSVHQTGEFDGQHFYSMDYVEGKTLADISRGNPLPSEKAADYTRQVASAVQYAHVSSILHRDLKPSNVLIDEKDRAQITDFGLAKQLGMDGGITDSGSTMGTPGFMSPEQALGKRKEIGSASDIYSLGAILYQLLTGRPPFRGESAMATISEVIHNEPIAPRDINPKVHRDLEAICLKCMAKDPYRRYATAQEVEDDLNRFLKGEPVLAKPLGRIARAWNWIRDVPIIAALIGRKFAGTTSWHHRVQWFALAIPLLVSLAVIAFSQIPAGLPEVIYVGSAEREGMYDHFCHALAAENKSIRVRIQKTQGSIENLQMLREGKIHAALAQVETLLSDDVVVIAPLFREIVYVFARQDRSIATMEELATRSNGPKPPTLWIGQEKSGMRVSAEAVLSRYDIHPHQVNIADCPLEEVIHHPQIDVAIVTAGAHNATLHKILDAGEFRLIPLPNAAELFRAYPTFRHLQIAAGERMVDSVATVSVLAVRKTESERLVTTMLDLLYANEELLEQYGVISQQDATAWIQIMDAHESARAFFQSRTIVPIVYPLSTP